MRTRKSSLGRALFQQVAVEGTDSGYRWVDITEGEEERRVGLQGGTDRQERSRRPADQRRDRAGSEYRHHSSFTHIVCECGYDRCDEIIALTKEEYEGIRNDPRQFCVVQEHVIQDVESIVEENDRFVIVAKREGTPAEVAIRTDPRG
jgi:hypothetical protein